MAHKLMMYDGTKMATLWGGAEEGWVIAGETDDNTIPVYFKNVSWMFRSIQLVAGNVAGVPFALVKNKEDVDVSTDWQNKVGFLPSPKKLLYLVAASLFLTGKAYLWKEYNALKTKGLRYILPNSVQPVIDPILGLTGFQRYAGSYQIAAKPEDIVYFWLQDPLVEIGPPSAYPALAAAKAAGVLYNVDEFATQFFKRGAVKVTLFEAEGMQKENRDEFLSWWKRMTAGISKSFSTIITNSKNLKPVVIGEGISELTNTELTREEKEAIATAMGIPFAILFSDAANYATAQQDWLNFLNSTILPLCDQIAESLNEQVFSKLGLKMVFRPEGLDAFQEDENQKAQSLGTLVKALTSPEEADIAMSILGYEMDDDTRAKFEALLAKKQENREAMAEQMKPAAEPAVPAVPVEQVEPDDDEVQAEKSRWMRKALKALEKGKSPNVEFVTDVILPEVHQAIAKALALATDEASIRSAFNEKSNIQPLNIADLVNELRLSRLALEKSS
mgnify:FL=1